MGKWHFPRTVSVINQKKYESSVSNDYLYIYNNAPTVCGWCVQMCVFVFQFLRPRELSGRELVKVLLLTVALCCLVISAALINVCLHLTQRLPNGAVTLIMVV